MERLIGFEPITIRVEAEYSIQLNYKRIYFLVPLVGVEPTRIFQQWILSPPCLPISPKRLKSFKSI